MNKKTIIITALVTSGLIFTGLFIKSKMKPQFYFYDYNKNKKRVDFRWGKYDYSYTLNDHALYISAGKNDYEIWAETLKDKSIKIDLFKGGKFIKTLKMISTK